MPYFSLLLLQIPIIRHVISFSTIATFEALQNAKKKKIKLIMIEEGDAPPTDISVSCVGRRHKTTTSSEKKHVMQLPTNQSKLLETTKMVLNDLLDESQFFYEKVKADSSASVVQTSRCIPHFGPREIITGRILGTGEFGVVVTVERLELKIAPADYPRHFNQNHIRNERHCDTVAEQNMPPPPSTPTPATINGVENQEEFSLAETLKHHHRAGSSTRMVSFADLGEAAKSVENATQEEVPEIPEPKYFHTRNETLGSASENFISEIKSNIGFPSPRIPPKSIIVLPSNVASMAADTAAGPSLSNVTTHIETTSESSPQMQGSGIISHPYVELKEENEVTETADDKSTYSELSEDVDDNDDDILKDIANKDEHEMVMRSHMALHAHRDGRPRYALKRLRPNLSPKCQIDAAIDLACEGQFLKLLSHSNIIRLRGFVGTPGTVEYALILDCLTQTLSEKLVKWRNKLQSYNGRVFGLFKDKAKIQHSITERLLAAFDIARGLRYLHRKKILYRDLKPDNIGRNLFDSFLAGF